MQGLTMRLLPLLVAVAMALTVADARSGARAGLVPRLVVPDDWVTDKQGRFMFLPLNVPKDVGLAQCKLLTSGDQILVVVTELPQDQPESDALRKFRLLLQALKSDAGNSERTLRESLTEWFSTEEDDEVRERVQEALTSMSAVDAAKTNPALHTVSVPLGLMQRPAYPSSVLQLRGSEARGPLTHPQLQHMLVGSTQRHQTAASTHRGAHHTGIVKESFSVDIPYPVESDAIFALSHSPAKILVAMPLVRSSLGAQGISMGGAPYVRIPVFGSQDELLAGSTDKQLGNFAPGMDLHALDASDSFVTLS